MPLFVNKVVLLLMFLFWKDIGIKREHLGEKIAWLLMIYMLKLKHPFVCVRTRFLSSCFWGWFFFFLVHVRNARVVTECCQD